MSDRRGFTLVEVVLSIAIAAMVVAMLFAALSLGQRAAVKGEARAEVAQRVMVLSERISWLISGAYPYRYFDTDKRKEVLVFEGEHDSLSLVTTSVDSYSSDPVDRAGLKHVRIHLDEQAGLTVSERMFYMTEAEPKDYVLEPEVEKLEFDYLEIDPDGGEADWMEIWDTEAKGYLPPAIRVKITIEVDGKQMSLPPVIVWLPVGGEEGLPIPLPKINR